MTTPRMPPVAPLTSQLVAGGRFKDDPFVLIDVGASGGIEEHWRVFRADLRAFGFDPLVKEVERLNRTERSPRVRYFEGFVGCEHGAASPGWSAPAYERSSARRAQELLGVSFTAKFNNEDPEIVHSRRRITLDGFFAENPVDSVDFIKIDTDGSDYDVLCGARGLLSSKRVLGLFVECQLHGPAHPHANTFASIDFLLRECGYTLFDIEVYRYTRASLPGRFMYRIPAQTFDGPVSFAEAFYARDLAAPGYDARWSFRPDAGKLTKLLCLFEMFGLPDCAAELLLGRADEFGGRVDQAQALDALALQLDPLASGYRALNEAFERAPQAFYPTADAGRPSAPSVADPRVGELKARLQAMQHSLSWRITAPLRQLRRLLPGR